jgi:hypothetical protein
MNDSGLEDLIRRLTVCEEAEKAAAIASIRTSADPVLLIAAALFDAASGDSLDRAARNATSTRDRQLVAIATAHLDRDHDRVDALVRDHLVDFPAHPIVAWIVANGTPGSLNRHEGERS